jgi:hypothetical protein
MDDSPYVGLRPFTEKERKYFFGRERDQRVVEANLYAARLSVLYGTTGVGKSSILLAGLVPRVRESGHAVVVVFREWQGAGFLAALKRELVQAVSREAEGPVVLDESLPLDGLIEQATKALGRPVFIVLDQFEEYFVNHPPTENGGSPFEAELARSVNRRDIEAAFLMSLREDSLASLDRFRKRIPRLLGNTLRLSHLSKEDAEQAIRGPLRVWNAERDEKAEVEDELVSELLRDVSVGSAKWVLIGGDDDKQRSAAANVDDGIETPFLQLVLERLWADSAGNGSRVLQLDTYLALDRAPGIVRRHFEEVLSAMSAEQRELCARFFDRLVTPSGGKIAYPIADLEQVAGELARHVPETIKALRDGRILQEVQLPDYRGVEIFHDVLGPAVLEWQRRLDEQRRRAEARRLRRRRIVRAALIAGTAVALALAFLGYLVYDDWRERRPWGAVSDLRTGAVYGLSGKQATVGRASDGYDNTVDFTNVPNPVSRLHLLVLPDGRASDLRSLYGTTVNGVFLKYGDRPRVLERGDIVVLAGIVPLRYEPVGYSRLQFWTPDLQGESVPGWAVLVDGRARAVLSVPRPGQYVDVRDGKLVVADEQGPDSVAQVGEDERGAYVQDLVGGPQLRVTFKEDDYAYPAQTLKDGDGHYLGNDQLSFGSVVFSTLGVRFQIVVRQL